MSTEPYKVRLTLTGVSALLFHRWNTEAVETKAALAKGSAGKKSDNVESYVWRAENGNIALPGAYITSAIVAAAKFRQDPRSPRKSAMDLFRAGIVPLTELADLGKPEWDFIDRRRAVVQRAAITRSRPSMRPGWQAQVELLIGLPEYISAELLREVTEAAGRFVGIGDYRPAFGRFSVTSFEEVAD
jgi:hypothetical protein